MAFQPPTASKIYRQPKAWSSRKRKPYKLSKNFRKIHWIARRDIPPHLRSFLKEVHGQNAVFCLNQKVSSSIIKDIGDMVDFISFYQEDIVYIDIDFNGKVNGEFGYDDIAESISSAEDLQGKGSFIEDIYGFMWEPTFLPEPEYGILADEEGGSISNEEEDKNADVIQGEATDSFVNPNS